MNPNFSSYHSKITADSLAHMGFILVVVLIQFWLTMKTHSTGDQWYALWLAAFSCSTLGFIIRLDTLVKRLGGWLALEGDPWEQALMSHAPSKYLMPVGDVYVLIPVICLLVYGQAQSWQYWAQNNAKMQIPYLLGTLVLMLVGIAWVVLANLKAKTGF